jgi:hypothetical protein
MESKAGWARFSITNYKLPITNLLRLVLPYYENGPPVDNPLYLP